MIKALYHRVDDAHLLMLTGHANYADHGEDLVCAAASSIVFALLGWLESNSEKLDYVNADVHEGDVKIACEGGEQTAAVFEMTAIGLLQLADSYPDHVTIDIVGLAD